MSVRVFSTKTCPWCVRAKQYLEGLGVEFDYIDVGANREMAMEMVNRTGQRGVPVIEINDTFVVGFDQHRIDEALQAAGLIA
ncbi:MAG TPA: glutaredoxin domain-containing protein [Synergistaceae bacterium]|nr:glutaredoxin domain-containing protein [Synergistaceae bacterium]HPJ26186.1 glutaredoxin domain-containing protein [Synergistaceae bacterium]HPQ37440.1 glutaredoxin domain-containing protein [Synergistaceae bacterium]